MRHISVLLSAFVLSIVAVASASRASEIVYNAYICTLGVDCNVGTHGTAPSSPGPTNADFRQFFNAHLGGYDYSDASFAWSTKTNALGEWFGAVSGPNEVHTQYLWQGGDMICCTIDEPYTIADGNDFGLFVGYDVYNCSASGSPIPGAFLGEADGNTCLGAVPFALSEEAQAVLDPYLAYDPISHPLRFVAIDNENRILATSGSTWFALTPVPEPASWLAAVAGLALLGVLARCRCATPLR